MSTISSYVLDEHEYKGQFDPYVLPSEINSYWTFIENVLHQYSIAIDTNIGTGIYLPVTT